MKIKMQKQPKRIVIGSDHAGFEMKEIIREYLCRAYPDIEVDDVGVHNSESVDYPDQAEVIAQGISERASVTTGVAFCGSGIGMNIALNRHRKIRAALCHDLKTARLARRHNDANVLVMGGRMLEADQAKRMVRAFLATPFEGGRHTRRVRKLG